MPVAAEALRKLLQEFNARTSAKMSAIVSRSGVPVAWVLPDDAQPEEAAPEEASTADAERTQPMDLSSREEVRAVLERLARGELGVDDAAAALDSARRGR